MSRALESQAEYGVVGAGALSRSLIGQLPHKARQIGPIIGMSYRVASRMANSLRAGYAARDVKELNECRVILFHAPAQQVRAMAGLLANGELEWKDRILIFCDCVTPASVIEMFRELGASVAVARQFGIAGSIMVEGKAPALAFALRLAAELKLQPIEITPGTGDKFAATLTLATGAFTPLIHRAASLLRSSGLRDKAAVSMATALFAQTVHQYEHSGRQSWSWHVRPPVAEQLEAEIGLMDERFATLFRRLILAGFEDFDKHGQVALELREKENR